MGKAQKELDRMKKYKAQAMKSEEQLRFERDNRFKQLSLDVKCIMRAIEFKKNELKTGQIVETMEGFKDAKPKFMIENEIDINEFHLQQRLDELERMKQMELPKNA